MPIYEYACTVCGHDFEAIVGVRAPNPECPQCAASTDKKISLSAFHLKGSGWYSDAYAGSDNKQPAGGKSTSDDSSSSASSDSTSSDSSSSSSSDSGSKPSSSTKPAKSTSSPSSSD